MNRKEQIEKATPSYIKEKYSHLDHSFIEVDNDKEGKQEAFREGARWADEHPYWHKTSEEMPEFGVEVIAYHEKWIDEDFNPNGTRIGFLNENDDFTSVYWWDEQDCYEINDGNFYKSPIDNIEPEFWAYIPKFPKPQDKKNDYAR